MSIDTYDTLAMIRPGASTRYDLDWIEQLVREVARGGGATVARKPAFPKGHRICLARNGVELSIYYSDEPHIALESQDIAAEKLDARPAALAGCAVFSRDLLALDRDMGLIAVVDAQLDAIL